MKTILVSSLALVGIALAGSFLASAKSPAPAALPAVAAATYTVDTVHSAVIFSTTHLNTSRAYGRFNDITGTFTVDTEKPENSKVEIQIKVESIDTAHSGRDDHLRGPDFFDVKQFPLATFTSSSVEKTAEKKWKVTGMLNLHGVKKEVTIPLEHTGEGKGREGEALIGFHGTFQIKRSDFGMKYGAGMLGDVVDMTVSVEAAAAK
jgi:polyisoprenoid-binding protein YceI